MNQNHYIIIPLVLARHSVPSSVETQAAGGDRDTDATETVTKVSITQRRHLLEGRHGQGRVEWGILCLSA